MLAAGTATMPFAVDRLTDDRNERRRGRQATETFTGEVRDIEGNRLSSSMGAIDRIDVVASAVPNGDAITETIDGDLRTQSARWAGRAPDGTFEIPIEPRDGFSDTPIGCDQGTVGTVDLDPDATADPGFQSLSVDENDRFVFVRVAVVVDPPGADPVEWFAMDAFDVSTFRDGDAQFTVDRRLLSDADAPVAIWERVGADPGAFEINVETRGRFHRRVTNDDNCAGPVEEGSGEERAEFSERVDADSGIITLQAPEDVAVDYRAESENGTTVKKPPGGFYTDDIDEANSTAANLSYLDRIALPEPLSVDRRVYPLASAFRSETADSLDDNLWLSSAYDPYNDGEQERQETNFLDTIFDVAQVILFGAGVLFSGGVGLALALTILGWGTGQLKNGTVPSPSQLPSDATDGDIYRRGSLPIDHTGYDFVTSRWRWSTYSFAQPFPVTFENDIPGAFCVRGLVRVGGVKRFQRAFLLDPQVRSPVDEPGIETPNRAPATVEPPTPRIDISRYDLNAGDEVTLDGRDSTAFRDLEIDAYDWTIVPPDSSGGELDIDGDGRPELRASGPGPGIDASGPTVTEELPVAGDYEIYLTVTDETGERSTTKANLGVQEPPPPEVLPVATDAGEECYFPPTGEAFPATGENAARHFGYGCGDWKVYNVVPGESYRVVAGIDDCPDCLLSDATFTVQEPAEEPDGVPGEDVDWEVVERQPDPVGKDSGEQTVVVNVVPESGYIRVRNRNGNAGLGFYASVYGPRPEDGSTNSDESDSG
jgi:hypothetical protein